jgi:hypothetical protein
MMAVAELCNLCSGARESAVVRRWRNSALLRAPLQGTLLSCVVALGFGPTSLAQQPVSNAPPAEPSSTNAVKAPVLGSVRFLNGDTLRGETVSIDGSQRVRWQNPDIKTQIEFGLADISSIRLPALSTPIHNENDNCHLRLLNNDEFRGTLESMDDDKVVLKTWYAGPLTFARDSVRWVRLTEGEQFLYHGPTGLEGWTVSESLEQPDADGAWGFAKGVFFARRGGGVARDFKLPDRAAIDFDVAWREFLQLTVTIYTESLRVFHLRGAGAAGVVVNGLPQQPQQPQPGAGFYALHLNYNAAYLMTVRKTGEIVNSPVEMISGLEQKNRARFGIRADKTQKTISLLLDGRVIRTWQEPDAWAGAGTAVRFVQQGAAPLNVSNIRVAQWDGSLERPAIGGTNSASSTNDFIQLKNQDSLAGKIEAVRDGALVIDSTLGKLNIPLDRIAQFDVSRPDAPPPAMNDALVRAYFAGGGSITFKLEEWNERGLLAGSPHFGKAHFNPAAFVSIEFNLPRQSASAAP